MLPSSSRTPGLLSRRANGARDSIRLCAAMETTSSTHSKYRRSGSTQHSGMCLEVGDLPEQGADAVTRFILITMVSRFTTSRAQTDSPRKEAAGRPTYRGTGLGPRYGGGPTIPVCGDCPAPPKKKRICAHTTVQCEMREIREIRLLICAHTTVRCEIRRPRRARILQCSARYAR